MSLALYLARVRSSDLLGRISSHLYPCALGLENVQQVSSLGGADNGKLQQFFVHEPTSKTLGFGNLEASAIKQRIGELLAAPGTGSDPTRILIPG
jgi:hypothetical protein